MVRTPEILMVGGALVLVPLSMGGIPLLKLLLFALVAFFGLWGNRDTYVSNRSFLAFFAVVFLSPLWSAAPFLSIVGVEPRFEGVMAYVVFFGLALLAGGMVRAGREQDLLRVILWSNVVVVSYGLLQLSGMDPFRGWWEADLFLGRVFSTVGQPNMLAQFLLLTAPFAVLTAWRRWGHGAAYGVLGGNLLVLLATGSRAGMVGASVATSFYLLSRGERIKVGGSKEFLRMLLILGVLSIGLSLGLQRFSLPGEWDRSIQGRLAIWRDAATMIRARPFGWGLETTGLVFPRFQHAPLTAYESLTASVDRAHSKPLDLLLTVGPLGLFGYYGFLTMLIIRCLRAWRCHRDGLALAGAVSLLGMSVSLLFGFEGMVVHAFFWLICGMMIGGVPPSPFVKGEGQGERVHWYIIPILLLVVVVITGLWLSARLTVEHAEQALHSGDLVAAVQGYDRAVRRAPWDRALLVRFLETVLFAHERVEDRETEYALDAALEKRVHSLRRLTSGNDPLLPSLQAWQAALQGKRKEALGLLDDAKIHAPFSIPRLRIAARVAQLLGDKTMENALRTKLENMLPPWWNDVNDPRSRILRKENPWVEESRFHRSLRAGETDRTIPFR